MTGSPWMVVVPLLLTLQGGAATPSTAEREVRDLEQK